MCSQGQSSGAPGGGLLVGLLRPSGLFHLAERARLAHVLIEEVVVLRHKVGRNLYNIRQPIIKQLLAPGADYTDGYLLERSTELAGVLGLGNKKLHGHGIEDGIASRDTEFIEGRHIDALATNELRRR